MVDQFLGVVLVVRQASSQSQVVLQYPRHDEDCDTAFGLAHNELSKFAMPTQWLMNRKLDFEIEQCGPALSLHCASFVPPMWHYLRCISFPCDCEEDPAREDTTGSISPVTAFNIVFLLDSREVNDEEADLYWQALATLSRALIVEERRCMYLSEQVAELSSQKDCSLAKLLQNVYQGLSSGNREISVYVNECILTHLSVIPFNRAPDPPAGHQSIILTVKPDELQEQLPVDAVSTVRRLIDSADPSKTIKDHMVELGLPMSTIQRISQHLVYWGKAKIMPPLNKRMVLSLSPCREIVPSPELLADFRNKFGLKSDRQVWYTVMHLFSKGKRLVDVKEELSEEVPILGNRFSELCHFLLSNDVLTYSSQFFRYFPPTKRIGAPSLQHQRPKFQNALPHEIRSEYSPVEFEIIYERLRFNATASELMIKLISKYVKRHRDLLTARVELNEQYRCTNEEFHKYTEPLTSGYLDSLLVKYDCDL
jgi:hypothetical protein